MVGGNKGSRYSRGFGREKRAGVRGGGGVAGTRALGLSKRIGIGSRHKKNAAACTAAALAPSTNGPRECGQ